jgi:hypothetical protein
MIDETLENMAEKLLTLDEESLTRLLPRYKEIMDSFEPTLEWEKSVIIYFMINAVRVKNSIFNEQILDKQGKKDKAKDKDSPLKLVKS